MMKVRKVFAVSNCHHGLGRTKVLAEEVVVGDDDDDDNNNALLCAVLGFVHKKKSRPPPPPTRGIFPKASQAKSNVKGATLSAGMKIGQT